MTIDDGPTIAELVSRENVDILPEMGWQKKATDAVCALHVASVKV